MLEDIRLPPLGLEAVLAVPATAEGLILFAHGHGHRGFSPRQDPIAAALFQAGYATLMLDLSTGEDPAQSIGPAADPAAIELALAWAAERPIIGRLPVGCFATGSGTATALAAAAGEHSPMRALVSCDGRLGDGAVERVRAPTLLIIGSGNQAEIDIHRRILARLRHVKELDIVAGADTLFDEPGALAEVARSAIRWFDLWLPERPAHPVATGEPRRPA